MEEQNFNHLKSTISRFKAESPDYFQKLMKIGIGIGVTCGILRACGMDTGIGFPQEINTILNIGISIGACIAGISKLTVK